jgi:uncharacterized protein with GYD domain
MMRFIVFGNFSQQGIQKVMNVTECSLEMKTLVASVGGQLIDLHYTLGRYDFVAFIEAPDEKAMLKALMELAKFGAMRTETLVAVPAKETAEIIKEEGDQSASPGWRTCFNQI